MHFFLISFRWIGPHLVDKRADRDTSLPRARCEFILEIKRFFPFTESNTRRADFLLIRCVAWHWIDGRLSAAAWFFLGFHNSTVSSFFGSCCRWKVLIGSPDGLSFFADKMSTELHQQVIVRTWCPRLLVKFFKLRISGLNFSKWNCTLKAK